MPPQAEIDNVNGASNIDDQFRYQQSLETGEINLLNEIRLKYFAIAVAQSLNNSSICELIKEESTLKRLYTNLQIYIA